MGGVNRCCPTLARTALSVAPPAIWSAVGASLGPRTSWVGHLTCGWDRGWGREPLLPDASAYGSLAVEDGRFEDGGREPLLPDASAYGSRAVEDGRFEDGGA